MPNTSSAKKALRGSLKKKAFNLITKSKIKNALRDFRKAITTSPSEYQITLSKAFSALDKAVKTNFIPRGRADRKKARLAAQAAKANIVEVESTEKIDTTPVVSKAKKTTIASKVTKKKPATKAKNTTKKAV
ncbi:MAG: 30S ribosomal protein S20 [candidate division SR1 bacterium]|nr:30S ribosomal protein S20 [candidate division SR1 bacterium]